MPITIKDLTFWILKIESTVLIKLKKFDNKIVNNQVSLLKNSHQRSQFGTTNIKILKVENVLNSRSSHRNCHP